MDSTRLIAVQKNWNAAGSKELKTAIECTACLIRRPQSHWVKVCMFSRGLSSRLNLLSRKHPSRTWKTWECEHVWVSIFTTPVIDWSPVVWGFFCKIVNAQSPSDHIQRHESWTCKWKETFLCCCELLGTISIELLNPRLSNVNHRQHKCTVWTQKMLFSLF